MRTVLAAVIGALLPLGVILAAFSFRPRPPAPARPTRTPRLVHGLQSYYRGHTPTARRRRRFLAVAVIAGIAAWVLSGWVIAVVIVPAAILGLPALLRLSDNKASITKLEAMEEWTRSLSGVLTVGVGLEEAIVATLRSTPEPIYPQVSTLVARLRARWRTEAALRAFADDLDDSTGDIIASALMLGANRRGPGLASVLDGLATTVAQDVRNRRSIEADRATPRTTARVITIITLAILAGLALNTDYVEPYGTGLGQIILIVLLSAYVGALYWLRRSANPPRRPRFLTPATSGPQGGQA